MEIVGFEDGICVIDDFFDGIDFLLEKVNAGKQDYHKVEGDCIDRYTLVLDKEAEELAFAWDYVNLLRSTVIDAYGIEVNHKGHIPFMVYEKGCSMHYHDDMYHNADDEHNRIKQHIYSSVHFINDSYEGGELDFRDLDVRIPKKKNRLILFRSEYIHGSLEVLSGKKISSTQFWSELNEVN